MKSRVLSALPIVLGAAVVGALVSAALAASGLFTSQAAFAVALTPTTGAILGAVGMAIWGLLNWLPKPMTIGTRLLISAGTAAFGAVGGAVLVDSGFVAWRYSTAATITPLHAAVAGAIVFSVCTLMTVLFKR